jgi:hypothetical protein
VLYFLAELADVRYWPKADVGFTEIKVVLPRRCITT